MNKNEVDSTHFNNSKNIKMVKINVKIKLIKIRLKLV